MEKFRILRGLPGEGEVVQFSTQEESTFREGFLVEFLPGTERSWVGNFQSGFTQHNSVLKFHGSDRLLVISGGRGYWVDPETKKCLGLTEGDGWGGGVSFSLETGVAGLIVFGDLTHFWGMDEKGIRWESDRISWDGFRDVKQIGEKLVGESWDVLWEEGRWIPFELDVRTGKVIGGAYRIAHIVDPSGWFSWIKRFWKRFLK